MNRKDIEIIKLKLKLALFAIMFPILKGITKIVMIIRGQDTTELDNL